MIKITYSTFNLGKVGLSQRNICGFELDALRVACLNLSVWQCKCDFEQHECSVGLYYWLNIHLSVSSTHIRTSHWTTQWHTSTLQFSSSSSYLCLLKQKCPSEVGFWTTGDVLILPIFIFEKCFLFLWILHNILSPLFWVSIGRVRLLCRWCTGVILCLHRFCIFYCSLWCLRLLLYEK